MVLLVVIIGSQARFDPAHAAITTAFTALFALFYFAFDARRDRISIFRIMLWLLLLTLVWVALLPMSPVAVYLVFALYFVYLEALPDARGVVAVVGATVISICSQYPHITPGGVLGPSVAALVSVSIVYTFRALWRVSQERQELIEELLETQTKLSETERAAGRAAERQRIAHEIHDTLAQGLSSIQMLLHVAEQDIAAFEVPPEQMERPLERIKLARHVAADNLGEARAMIAALQPAALSKTSLEAALQRVAAGMPDTTVSVSVDGDERQLPMRTEAALLRIAQGAMGNVVKHSQAQNCHVTLTYDVDQVRLDVVDDGVGFDPETVGQRPVGLGHIGLNAMRQRAAELGGAVDVESEPGGGTAVSIALPVD